MAQTGTDTLTMTAPNGLDDPLSASLSCSAEVYSFVIVDGKKIFTSLGRESAPYELTLSLPPLKGKSGKR